MLPNEDALDYELDLGVLLGISALELLDLSVDVMVVLDSRGSIEFVSAAVADLVDRRPESLIGLSISDVVHPDDLGRVAERLAAVLDGQPTKPNSIRVATALGQWRSVEAVGRTVRSSRGEKKLVISLRDNSERAALIERLQTQATRDQLTGLLSLAGFLEVTGEDAQGWSDRSLLVMRVDVAGFQRINQFYGHQVGDAVLRSFGGRFAHAAPPNSLTVRLGSDDFVVVQPLPSDGHTSGEAGVQRLAHAFAEKLVGSFENVSVNIDLSVRIGVSVACGNDNVLQAISNAEEALTAAKRDGASIRVFDAELSVVTTRRRTIESALRTELRSPQRLQLAYQPIVDAASRRVVSFEGLARWSPDGLVVGPAEFVPVAEATGLIGSLTEHVLTLACSQLASWNRSMTGRALGVSVNVPVSEVDRPGFVAMVERTLDEHNVAPQQLIIELTESNMVERLDVVRSTLAQLNALGCAIAIDDFGTGYSSFSWLRDLPVQIVKIDRSFVWAMTNDAAAAHVVRAIADLCRCLGSTVIAEGVETQAQADMLTSFGIDRLQGFAFGHAGSGELAGRLAGQRITAIDARAENYGHRNG